MAYAVARKRFPVAVPGLAKSPALKRLTESVCATEKGSRCYRKSLGVTQYTDTDKAKENDRDDSPECPCSAIHDSSFRIAEVV